MYIKKYWGNFIGGSDDSLNLVAFLEDQKKEEIPLSEIFAKIGLDKQNWDFRQTVEYLEFTHSDGVEMDFHFAIDVVTDLAAILLECSVSGSVNLQDLDEYIMIIGIHVAGPEIAVFHNTVPVLPDSRCAFCDRIKPGRIVFPQQK